MLSGWMAHQASYAQLPACQVTVTSQPAFGSMHSPALHSNPPEHVPHSPPQPSAPQPSAAHRGWQAEQSIATFSEQEYEGRKLSVKLDKFA